MMALLLTLKQSFVIQKLRAWLRGSQQIAALPQAEPGLPLKVKLHGSNAWKFGKRSYQP
jgi:hypothetical protein